MIRLGLISVVLLIYFGIIGLAICFIGIMHNLDCLFKNEEK